MASIPVGGIKALLLDGIAVDVISLDSFSINMQKLSTVEVEAGSPGYSVKPVMPHIEVTISTRGIRIYDYVAQGSVNVQLFLMNNRSYVWPNAHEVSDGTANPLEGKLTLRYESETAKEL